MRPTTFQPFHKDLDPNLAKLVDDFLVEVDRLLRGKPKKKGKAA